LLADASPLGLTPDDERALLSINYTSGTTGRPKGVMYHHRGAYLQALAMVGHTGLTPSSVHLWTLPMFHCNGWCFPWAVTAAAATHVCLPKVEPSEVWRLIREEGVTHLNGAPTVLSMLAYASDASRVSRSVRVATGGAPPSPAILRRMGELGFEVTHLYGLTETFGPVMICDWRPEWNDLDTDQQARLKARQGVGNMISCRARVVDDRGNDVPADGAALGEIALRGNNVMLGYLDENGGIDAEETAQAVPDGWFRTGDLGVMHPDGYVELKDRGKDVIISGGENIASVEVEQAIMDHPAVLEVAVVAAPDDKWGEAPVAFVTLQEGAEADEVEIIQHVRSRLAHFKAPRTVTFGDLPKTSTGKIQKFVLREDLWAGAERRIQ
ncbi:MAG: AMP-binding protein, partial [Pseudonocardia sp.]|nr:AMP-binding protein [Pseudonocardia sp.]